MRGKINKSLSTIPWFDLQILNNFYSLLRDRLFWGPDPRHISLQISPYELIWDSIETVVSAIKCWWAGGVRSIRSLHTSQLNLILIHDPTFVIAFRFQLDSPPINNSLKSHKFLCFFLTFSSSFSQVLILSLKLLNVKAFM